MGRRPEIKGFKAVERLQPSRACAPRRYFRFFLSLPMELRCRVYDNLLHCPHVIDPSGIWHPNAGLSMSLLRVSKFVSVEAAKFFYTVNTFVLLEDYANDKDGIDIEKSFAYDWLTLIERYAPSLRSVQIRIRRERPVPYYIEMLSMLASYAPNITRIALVAEGHKLIDVRRSHSSIFQWLYKWHPNEIMPFKGNSLSGRFCKALLGFENLSLVVVGGRQKREVMDKLCERLGTCRVLGLEDEAAGREAFALWDTLWKFDGTWEEVKWYEAVMAREDGQRVLKQSVKEGEKKGDNDGEAKK